MKATAKNPHPANGRSAPSAPPGLSYWWIGDPNDTAEPKDFVVEGLIGAGEIVVLHARPKAGKSAFAAHISFAVATGSDWFERKTLKGPVIFCALEKWRVTQKRLAALQKQAGDIQPDIAITSDPLDLTSSKSVDALIETARQIEEEIGDPVRLIVIDTLNRAMAGIDENSAGPMGSAFNALSRIADQTGAAIIVVHHNSKGTGTMRGSTVVEASADVVISLERDKKDEGGKAIVVAANDVPEDQVFAFKLQAFDLAHGETTVVVDPVFDNEPHGARSSAPSPSRPADRDRARDVLRIVRSLEVCGSVSRADLLEKARDAGIVSQGSRDSSAEQMRRALVALQNDGALTFTNREVRLP